MGTILHNNFIILKLDLQSGWANSFVTFFALGAYVSWIKIKQYPCVLLWQKDFAFQNRGICSCSDTQNWCCHISLTWRSCDDAVEFWKQLPEFGIIFETALQPIEMSPMMYWSKVRIFDFTTLYDLSLFREKAHCSAYCVHRLEKRGTMKWLCPAVKYFTDFTMTCLGFAFSVKESSNQWLL